MLQSNRIIRRPAVWNPDEAHQDRSAKHNQACIVRKNSGDDYQRPEQSDQPHRLKEELAHGISRAHFFHLPAPQKNNQKTEGEDHPASESDDVA